MFRMIWITLMTSIVREEEYIELEKKILVFFLSLLQQNIRNSASHVVLSEAMSCEACLLVEKLLDGPHEFLEVSSFRRNSSRKDL